VFLATAGALATLLPAAATAQSVPELEELARIARSFQQSRTAAPRATRVFTNENIRLVGSPLAAASGTIAPTGTLPPADVPEPRPGVNGEAPVVGGRTEVLWRQAFAEAREEIGRAEDRLELAEQELQALDRRLLTESSLYNREGQLGPIIVAKREEIAAAEGRVQEANAALEALRTELRTAGGPPGWAR
jgi:hypothetical protein